MATTQEIAQAGNLLNETLNESTRLTFEKAFEVTSDPYFFVPMIAFICLAFLIYFIWGAVARVQTPSGRWVNIISTNSFWIIFVIFLFFMAIAIILTIFPIHLKFFNF